MATKLKHQQLNPGENVVAITSRCSAEGCSQKTELMNFCREHYEWFKWGLVTKEGKRPSDFDKKHQAFLKKKIA